MPNCGRVIVVAASRLLHGEGFRVVEAATGGEALRLLGDKPDLVLLDVQLPDLNGFEVCARLRADPATAPIPVLMVTGVAVSAADQVRGLGCADGYLVKPVEPAVLVAQIRALLRARRAEEALRQNEERWRALVEIGYDAVALLDATGAARFVGPSTERLFGFRPEDCLGRDPAEFLHPEDRDGVLAKFADLARTPGAVRTSVHRSRHKDGSWRWVEAVGKNLLHDPAVAAIVTSYRDVTERKQMEEALRRSDDRLRDLVENAGDIIYSHDLQGNLTAWSRGGEQILGFTREEMQGQNIAHIVAPDQLDLARKMTARKLAGDARTVYELEVLARDGRRVTLEINSRLEYDGGRPVGVQGIARDVTERKQAEQLLRQREQHLRAIVQASPECIKVVAPDGTLLDMNPAGLAMIDADSLDAVAGQPIYRLIVPEDREAYRAFHERVCGGTGGTVEFGVVGLRGTRRRLETHAVPLRLPDGRTAHLGVTRDVTQRRRDEEELRQSRAWFQAILRASRDGIVVEENERVVFANAAYARLYGYERPEELVGRHVSAFQAPEDNERMLEYGRRRLRGEDAPTVYAFRGRRQDGTVIELEASASTFAVRGRSHIITVVRDVAERLNLEERLRQAQKMEAVGRLAGGVAHDFNNLLTVINGFSEILLGQLPAGSPERATVEQIHKAGERAADVTRQLLAFGRRQLLQPKVLDLNAVVRDAETLLGRLIGEDVTLVTELDPAVGRVRADPGQLVQVILNLAANARDAMPQGGTLTLATRGAVLDGADGRGQPPVAPGPYAVLEVRDTGCGMDAETRTRAFEPFFTTKDVGKGAGLGLATVYGIVTQSGGHVEVDSAPGRGAAFRVYLPQVEQESGPNGSAPEHARIPTGTERVLLAEDEAAVRDLLRRSLQSAGYTVLAVKDGAEALEAARAAGEPLHVLVTDVVMPGMSGRQLAEAVRALHPAVQVLYVSGYTDDALVRHGVQRGEVAFLQKPFTPADLARKIRQLLAAGPTPTPRG